MSGAIVQKSLISMQTSCQVAPMPWRDRVQQENEDFYRQLQCFPSMLNVPGYRNINTNRWRSVRDRVEAERGQGGDTVMELSRDANLVAFALFQLKEFKQALQKTEEVLKMDGLNLVANANKATLSWNMGDKFTAREQIAHLKKIKEQAFIREKEVEGKAEIAYCCSRLGPAYAQLSVQYFEEVVEQRPEEMDWKLGLAMMLQRSMYANSRMCHGVDTDNALKMGEKAAMLLHEVQGSNAPDLVKALAAAKLGGLLVYKYCDVISELGGAFATPDFPLRCIQEAERLAPTNVSVLTVCGQFFVTGKYRNTNKAHRLLQKSIDIRPTANALLKLGQLWGLSSQHQKSLSYYKKCVEISYGESTHARVFIANIHKRMNNLSEVLHECEQILSQDKSLNSPLDQIRAYEMAGLVYLQMDNSPSQSNTDRPHVDVHQTKEKGLQLLEQALYMQSHISATNPELTRFLQSHGQSFRKLLDAIRRDTSLSPVEKLKREARLYYIIGEGEKAVDVFKKVPDDERLKEDRPDILEMELRCLIKTKDYMSALLFVAYLDASGKLENLRKTGLTGLPVLVYVLAGQRRLTTVGTWTSFDFNRKMAQNSFLWAFDYMFPRATLDLQPTEGACDSDAWHVTILHDPEDDDVAQAAQSVKVVLTEACGLHVTCMSDDVHPGCTELFGVLEQADNCRLLMVVLGNTEPSEEFLRGYLAPCLSPPSMQTDNAPRRIVVQTLQERQSPRVLCGYPSCLCPSELLSGLQKRSLYFTETEIKAICSFFCAMLGVDGIEQYLTKLEQAGLIARPSKCFLGYPSLQFLGFEVGEGSKKPDTTKVDKILNASRPSTKKEVSSLLGLIGYYREFIPNFSSVTTPLTDLTRKGRPYTVDWAEKEEKAFTSVKKRIASFQILRLPDFSSPFILRMDASGKGVGAVLILDKDGKTEFLIQYTNRKLSDCEKRYAISVLEYLAVVWAINKFQKYLNGRSFVLETDHEALAYLNNAKPKNNLQTDAVGLDSPAIPIYC